MAVAGAGAGAEIMVKSEPEPKINNFGSATLVLATRPYVVFITRGVFFIVVVVLLLLFCVSPV